MGFVYDEEVGLRYDAAVPVTAGLALDARMVAQVCEANS